MRKRSMLTVKKLKQCKISKSLRSEIRVYNWMANFGEYLGDFMLWSGDQEIWSKIRSLPDYLGELTALFSFSMKQQRNC